MSINISELRDNPDKARAVITTLREKAAGDRANADRAEMMANHVEVEVFGQRADDGPTDALSTVTLTKGEWIVVTAILLDDKSMQLTGRVTDLRPSTSPAFGPRVELRRVDMIISGDGRVLL